MISADSVRRILQSSITHCKIESCKSRQLKFYLFSAHDIQHLERQREDDERKAGPECRTEDAVLMEDEDGEEDAVDRLEIEGEADGKGGDGALGTVQEEAHADGTAEGEQQQVCGVYGSGEENGGGHSKTIEGQQDSQGGTASGHLQGGDSECIRNGAGTCGLYTGSIRGSRRGTEVRAGV